MTPEQIRTVVPLIAVGILALALLFFLSSLRFFRKSRTDFYWRRRRAAGQRGWRLFVWSIVLSLLSGMLCLATGVVGLITARQLTPTVAALVPSVTLTATAVIPTATATATPTLMPPSATPTISPTPTLIPPSATLTWTATTPPASVTWTVTTSPTRTLVITRTRTNTPGSSVTPSKSSARATATPTISPTISPTTPPTRTPTISPTATSTTRPASMTPTPMPTATLTATITLTPTETLVASSLTTASFDSSVTPGASATITITALDTQVSDDGNPVNPSATFKAGFNRIFFFVNFSGMQSGVLWRRELLFNDQPIQRHEYLWGMAQSGTAFFFFGQEGGFKPGKYMIRLYIGESTTPVAAMSFMVID